ncbi:hypothetical protein BKA69DRAFT_1063153 [Paraphysoderma sedebokerense]|nr:hypothetical protein BKA69DRAFT_1063153 [Paraphysoderma sedebokerense]
MVTHIRMMTCLCSIIIPAFIIHTLFITRIMNIHVLLIFIHQCINIMIGWCGWQGRAFFTGNNTG